MGKGDTDLEVCAVPQKRKTQKGKTYEGKNVTHGEDGTLENWRRRKKRKSWIQRRGKKTEGKKVQKLRWMIDPVTLSYKTTVHSCAGIRAQCEESPAPPCNRKAIPTEYPGVMGSSAPTHLAKAEKISSVSSICSVPSFCPRRSVTPPIGAVRYSVGFQGQYGKLKNAAQLLFTRCLQQSLQSRTHNSYLKIAFDSLYDRELTWNSERLVQFLLLFNLHGSIPSLLLFFLFVCESRRTKSCIASADLNVISSERLRWCQKLCCPTCCWELGTNQQPCPLIALQYSKQQLQFTVSFFHSK